MTDAMKSSKIKKRYLKLSFGKEREEYKNQTDDRGLFCNTYDILMEACEAMSNVENNTIWVAFNRYFRQEVETLEEIKQRFQSKVNAKNRFAIEWWVCFYNEDKNPIYKNFGEDEQKARDFAELVNGEVLCE